jgi:hypothetical protein
LYVNSDIHSFSSLNYTLYYMHIMYERVFPFTIAQCSWMFGEFTYNSSCIKGHLIGRLSVETTEWLQHDLHDSIIKYTSVDIYRKFSLNLQLTSNHRSQSCDITFLREQIARTVHTRSEWIKLCRKTDLLRWTYWTGRGWRLHHKDAGNTLATITRDYYREHSQIQRGNLDNQFLMGQLV